MNVLKRILLILLGLALVVLVSVLFLVPETVVSVGQNIAQQPSLVRIAFVVIADLLILWVMILLIRPAPRISKDGLVVRSKGVIADVSTASARERVLKAVREVRNVVSAEAKLAAINGKADIELQVVVSGDNINVPEKQKELDRALQQVVVKQLGLQMASRPRVHIQFEGVMPPEPAPAPPAPLPVTEKPAPVTPPPVTEIPVTPPLATEELRGVAAVSAPEFDEDLLNWIPQQEQPEADEDTLIQPAPTFAETVEKRDVEAVDEHGELLAFAHAEDDSDETLEEALEEARVSLPDEPSSDETADEEVAIPEDASTPEPETGLYEEDDERRKENEDTSEHTPPA